MKANEPEKFFWSGLFIVTSFCFIFFSGLLKLINGSAEHSSLFLTIGIVALVLSGVSFIVETLARASADKD